MSSKASPSFRHLVDAHYKGLYRFAYSLCKDEHQASDLTQQTFAIYAEKSSSLRDPSKAKSWLFTTLYREFLYQNRKNQQAQPHDPSLLEATLPIPDTPALDSIDKKRILSALDKLEETYRAPLLLYYQRSFSYQEIADVLDIPIGTVMSRLSRGKIKLKTIFLASDPLNET